TIASIFVAHPMGQIAGIPAYFKKLLSYPLDNPAELINKLVRYAELARKNGILALDGATDDSDDPFMAKGLQLAVDGIDPDQIKETMESELFYLQDRHATGKAVMTNFGKYAPAFGMVGTLIGLVMMLKNLSDFNSIGPNMAVALITTFYGAVLSNLFFLPAADKLAIRDKQEKMNKEIIINGVLSIQAGDNPRMVEQKLKVYLPPHLREVEGEAAA
ncbi:MAG: MotA/TolQ/ExbB proton channel family protein, partial [Planctomycetes bacterium]|nr:MotA/TolQ/ExbB proton channel family protein [Planctomycetota bacterium]